jgi:hypothetical protein
LSSLLHRFINGRCLGVLLTCLLQLKVEGEAAAKDENSNPEESTLEVGVVESAVLEEVLI